MSIDPRERVEVVDTNYPLSKWDRHTHTHTHTHTHAHTHGRTDRQTDIIDPTTKVKTLFPLAGG